MELAIAVVVAIAAAIVLEEWARIVRQGHEWTVQYFR